MSNGTDTNWLMQYRLLRLVNQCRRLIQSEFGVRLTLTNDDLRAELATYAGKTRNQSLQRVYAELRLALIEFEGPDPLLATPAAPSNQRRYRGQVMHTADEIAEEDGLPSMAPPAAEGASEGPSEKTPATKTHYKRMYRGRVVED
ncbi:MAG: hypothetical protein LAT61_08765 [Alcanivorax sp.]|nr:hypothetical protein [Alcanivorax sp.]